MNRNVCIAAFTALVISCGASPRRLENRINRITLPPDSASEHRRLVAEGDAHWAKRSSRSSVESALLSWEAAVALMDDDHESYAKLAHGYYFLADAYLAFDAMGGGYPYDKTAVADKAVNDKFINTHLRGIEHAERGMAALSEEFEKRTLSGIGPEDAVAVLDAHGVPLAYWYAANLGKWASAMGMATGLKHKDRIYKMAAHVLEGGPDYFYGAADRYFGAFYAAAPAFAGGDLKKSQTHFEASIKAGPNYLGTYVLAAEYLATKNGDVAAFDGYLNAVIGALEDPAEIAPENAIEKRKAATLLSKRDSLF